MKIRTFIFGLILTGSIFTILSFRQQKNTITANTGEKVEKNIYLQLYTIREEINKDFDVTIKTVADIGYSGVEVINYTNGMFYNMTPAVFKKKIEAVGMEALSSHTRLLLADNIADTNWSEIWEWWDTAIDAHKRAGMKYIVIPGIPKFQTLKELHAYCDYMNQIGERCNAAGLRLGYHNHSAEFNKIENEVMLDYMLKNTDPDKVFFQMDVYWTVRGDQSPVEYFEKYPGRFEILHIKDHKELGQSGMVGFDAIFKNIEKSGAKYIIVEADNYNFPPMESIKISYDYLTESPFVKVDYAN